MICINMNIQSVTLHAKTCTQLSTSALTFFSLVEAVCWTGRVQQALRPPSSTNGFLAVGGRCHEYRQNGLLTTIDIVPMSGLRDWKLAISMWAERTVWISVSMSKSLVIKHNAAKLPKAQFRAAPPPTCRVGPFSIFAKLPWKVILNPHGRATGRCYWTRR